MRRGAKVYVAQTRGPGGPKRVTVGRHGVISADQARRRAALIIARVKAGQEPIAAPMAPRTGPTVAELAARYLEEHMAVRCKPGTTVRCRRVIRKYILPDFGELPLAAVEREHVTEMHYKLCDVPAMANRVVATLSRMFNQAEAWGLAPEGSNPSRFLVKYKERRRERFLTEEEFRRLGRLLSEAAAEGGGLGASGSGDPAADADRVPAQRDSDAALEGCRSQRGRIASAGRQDRTAGGSSVAGRGEACCWPAARSRQSVGLSRQETGCLSNECRRSLASGEGARRAG